MEAADRGLSAICGEGFEQVQGKETKGMLMWDGEHEGYTHCLLLGDIHLPGGLLNISYPLDIITEGSIGGSLWDSLLMKFLSREVQRRNSSSPT